MLTTDPDEENFVVQTGKQKSRGVELDLAGEVWPGWNLIASLGVLDAGVTDDPLIAEGTRIVNAPRFSDRI